MTESYEVYVGNLPTDVLKQKLEELFSDVGDIVSIWINPKYKQITYAFITFGDYDTANEACKRFDNYELNFSKLKVKMSFMNVGSKGILLDLTKKKGRSKSYLLKKLLVKNLRENPEIAKDFATACKEAEDITLPKQLQMIKTAPEQSDLSSLEETIIRNFKTPRQKNAVPVDFDLSKGKLMSTDEYDKHFNVILTKPRFLVPEIQKQTIPFELDYRSVCE